MTSVKFPQEARGIFGAAIGNGTLEGLKAAPYDYTGKMVVDPTKFEKMIKAECARVMTMKGIWSRGKGYEGKDNWRKYVINKILTDGHICIIDLMDHVINESNKNLLYLTFMILRMVGKGSARLHGKGLNRQLMNTNEGNSTTRYNNKVVGDSPEICRALDSHGFAHLERSIKLQVAKSSCNI